ncbi:MAG TPA: cupin domain-containing protein [Mycobacteriales bacterium]|nr:cupin domain-containing protein [Mycobacteriales bacterium]
MSQSTLPIDRELASEPASSQAWWFLGTLAVSRNPVGAPAAPAVIELTVPPGGSPPRHVHADLDDAFLMLEGEAFIACGDRSWTARQGSYVVLPQGVEHTFRVTSTTPAKLLLIHADDSFLRFIAAVGTPTEDRQLPPDDVPTPDFEAVNAAWEANGGRFTGPSIEAAEVPA